MAKERKHEDKPADDTAEAAPAAAPRGGRAATLIGGLALILSILGLLSVAYLWTTFTQRQETWTSDTDERLAKLETGGTGLREDLTALQGETATVRETQDTIRAALERMEGELGRNRSEWMVAETEQLLVIANNRLQLARETGQALAALRAADGLLKQVANPALLPIRRTLAEEITALESLEQVDISGISLKLGTLATNLERLPLATGALIQQTRAAATTAPAETGMRAWLREVWQDLQNLVRIRSASELGRPLLLPEQQYYLRENLRLMLYGAQIALLRTDTATFEQNLRTAADWLKDYYDTDSAAVQAAQNDLQTMLKARLRVTPPDISRSLQALRRLTAKKAKP